MSTIKVNKIENTTTSAGGVAIDSSGHVQVDGLQMPSAGPLSNRNLIINGAMQIHQRGTSVAVTNSSTTFITDRFGCYDNTAGSITMSNSSESPDDFERSTKVEITSADASLTGSEQAWLRQRIEGQNIQHLNWGTSAAKTVTLSFWVRSSVTGDYSVALRNAAGDRVYPDLYNISTADTWEYKTVTVPGETTGTWDTGNGHGMEIFWSFGMASGYEAAPDAWSSTSARTATGETELIGTNGATWYITGVQLEIGSKATAYEHRAYSDELLRCQRYYYRHADGGDDPDHPIMTGMWYSSGSVYGVVHFPTTMRAAATLQFETNGNTSAFRCWKPGSECFTDEVAIQQNGTTCAAVYFYNLSPTNNAGEASWVELDEAGAHISFNAEL